MRMLHMDELIRRIEATEETSRPGSEDHIRTEIGKVLDHLRLARDSQVREGLQSRSKEAWSRSDLWYH